MSVGDSDRNAHGLLRLRRRYVRRATQLVTDADDRSFLEAVRSWAREWDETNPDFPCTPLRGNLEDAPTPPTLSLPLGMRHIARSVVFAPERLRGLIDRLDLSDDDASQQFGHLLRLQWDWSSGIHDIANRFWSPRDFVLPYGKYDHPATTFVSTCVFYDARDGDSNMDRWFPVFGLEPESIPYDLTEIPLPSEITVLRGQLEYFRKIVSGLAGSDALDLHDRRAEEAGWESYRTGTTKDWDQKMWILPIVPGMSVQDLRAAEPRIIGAAKGVDSMDPFVARVLALRAEGMTQRKIADLLGASEKKVREIEQGTDQT